MEKSQQGEEGERRGREGTHQAHDAEENVDSPSGRELEDHREQSRVEVSNYGRAQEGQTAEEDVEAKVEEEFEVGENGGIVLGQVVEGLVPAEPSQRDAAARGQTIQKKLGGGGAGQGMKSIDASAKRTERRGNQRQRDGAERGTLPNPKLPVTSMRKAMKKLSP